jgi:ABC-2 type transport system permease protein
MKILPILLKREFWEHRKTFFYLPLIILVLSVIFLIAAVFTLQIAGEGIIISGSIQINEGGPEQRTETNEYSNMPINALFGDQLTQFAALEPKQREALLNTAYLLMATPLVSVLWVVVFMYFLTCLYDDRKDRSILFWKSMPVSDAMTVISKLLTGLLLVPGIYLVVMMILQLILLLTSLMAAVGSSIDIWATLIAPAQIVTRWIQMTAFFLFVAIWCLPIFAWVLFVSSWARSVPLAWVIGIPFVLVIIEWLALRGELLPEFIAQHAFPGGFFSRLSGGIGELYQQLLSLEVLLSLVLSALLLYGAIYFRGKADEL